jgi:VanZ family protein
VKIVIQIVPVIFVMGTIFFLSHQSGDRLNLPFPGADKLAHMSAYGVLALSVLWFFGKEGLESPGRTTFLTVLFCLTYGMGDEFHQSFIPLRSVSIFDLLADTAGAFCLSLIWVMNLGGLQQKMVSYQERLLTRFR